MFVVFNFHDSLSFPGVLPEDLQTFLEFQFPKASKRPKVNLGVSDAKLGAAITEATNITCSVTGAVPEILRGKEF